MPDITDPPNNLETRIRKLETTLDRLKVGAVIVVVLLLGYFGYTHWGQIPHLVDEAVKKSVNAVVPEKVHTAVEQSVKSHIDETFLEQLMALRSRATEAAASAEEYSTKAQASYNEANQIGLLHIDSGLIEFTTDANDLKRTVQFKKPFRKIPQVILAMTTTKHDHGSGEALIGGRVEEIRKDGFTFYTTTWANTNLVGTAFTWIAYAK